MSIGATVRIVQLDEVTSLEANDLMVVVDRSDTTISSEGSDKYVSARNAIETTPIRPSTDLAVSKPLTEWVGEFRDNIEGVMSRTVDATTGRFGVTRYATNTQARAKSLGTRTITPSNLSSMDSAFDFAGLIALASSTEVLQGTVNNKAITPQTLFQSILGDAALSNDNWVFKLPTRNISGGTKVELVVQVGQAEYSTMQTGSNPISNFNHIHQSVDVDVTFPQAFPNRTLMVIPIGFEVTESEYIEGTDFWVRPRAFTNSTAKLRASRMSGTSDGSEFAGVRYMAIGY